MNSDFIKIFHREKSGGFALIEVIVAVSLITTGLIAAYTLIVSTISSTTYASHRLTAAYLAQEGIELVRNIRDTNWLQEKDWETGLIDLCPSSTWCEIDYNGNLFVGEDHYLNIEDGIGPYGYGGGSENITTPFERKIYLDGVINDILKVRVIVEWQEKGHTNQISVMENLYNWK